MWLKREYFRALTLRFYDLNRSECFVRWITLLSVALPVS